MLDGKLPSGTSRYRNICRRNHILLRELADNPVRLQEYLKSEEKARRKKQKGRRRKKRKKVANAAKNKSPQEQKVSHSKYQKALTIKSRRLMQDSHRFPIDSHRMSNTEYAEYLESDHWLGLKDEWRQAGKLQECYVCGSRSYQLHHRTYIRIREEQLTDLVPLCGSCYRKVHRLVKAGKEMLDAHVYLKMLYQRGEKFDVRKKGK